MGYVEVDPKQVPQLMKLGYRQTVVKGRIVLIPPDKQEDSVQEICDKVEDLQNELEIIRETLKEFYKTYLKDRIRDKSSKRSHKA